MPTKQDGQFKLVCITCGYTTEVFNGWAFCGPCQAPFPITQKGTAYLHNYKKIKKP